MAYNLIPLICSGDVFGPQQPVILHLYDLPMCRSSLESLEMEINECAYPLVQSIVASGDVAKTFRDVDAVFVCLTILSGWDMEAKNYIAYNSKV